MPLNFASASTSTYHSRFSARDSSSSSGSIGNQIKAHHYGTETCPIAASVETGNENLTQLCILCVFEINVYTCKVYISHVIV